MTPRRIAAVRLLAVVGPGLLAGLSDDDPAGITTYSVLGTKYGERLLWVLLLSTVALIVFHELGSRMGVATGQGLIGLIRQRYGVRRAAWALLALLLANIGTMCAEFAGVAAGGELLGISRWITVPIAAVGVSILVLRGSFGRVEHVLMAVSAVFLTYLVAGMLAHPDWGAAGRGLVTPTIPLQRDAVVLAVATVGTTLAPWGLSFIQSYAVDKKLTREDMRFERLDVIIGATLTGVIGVFIVVACAATLHAHGIQINDAADAARALEPLAGSLASGLFAAGLLGAALLAASILPLSSAYSVCEFVGTESAVDDNFRDARLFYGAFGLVVVLAAGVVLLPGAPLVSILVGTQVLNAVLLLPLLAFVLGIARDRDLMGDLTAGPTMSMVYVVTIAFIGACVGASVVLSAT